MFLEGTLKHGCFCGNTKIEQRMQAALPWERPYPAPPILLPSLTTGLLIHGLGVCGFDESSNPFYYVHNCLHTGFEEKHAEINALILTYPGPQEQRDNSS